MRKFDFFSKLINGAFSGLANIWLVIATNSRIWTWKIAPQLRTIHSDFWAKAARD
jgi:hypothetical protein